MNQENGPFIADWKQVATTANYPISELRLSPDFVGFGTQHTRHNESIETNVLFSNYQGKAHTEDLGLGSRTRELPSAINRTWRPTADLA